MIHKTDHQSQSKTTAAATLARLNEAVGWWMRRDEMGGIKTAAKELFPEWNGKLGTCFAPHRDDHRPRFHFKRFGFHCCAFKDFATGKAGCLTEFVMLAGLDEEEAARWLHNRWLAAGSPPPTPREFSPRDTAPVVLNTAPNASQTANRAAAQPQEPAATESRSPAAITIAVAPPTEEKPWPSALDAAIVTSGELQQIALAPRPKLLGDWFCEGDLGFIFAFRGVGKTWLGLLLARAINEGGKCGEWLAPAPAPVLYVDGEMPPDLMRARDHGLARSGGNLEYLNHEILFRRTHRVMNITHTDVQRAILERCVATGVKLLILDNLSTLASGMKENDADDWDMVGRWLLDFRRRQIAVIMIHHAGRNGEMRGTTKREDDAFWIIALEDARQSADDRRGARFVSRFTKQTRNTPEEIPPYEWHITPADETGLIQVNHKLATGTDLLRQLIEQGITDCSELAEELNVSKGTVSKWAHKGMVQGWLSKDGRSYAIRE